MAAPPIQLILLKVAFPFPRSPRMPRALLPLSILALFVGLPARANEAEALFTRRVWPLLQEKCLACHGQDEAKIKGGLDLRTLAAARRGGDSGEPSLVPGRAEASPLFLSARRDHEAWEAMPPKEADRLSEAQLGWLREWIQAGAPWPDEAKRAAIAQTHAAAWSAEDGVVLPTTGALSPDWANRRYKPEALWAYQPVRKLDPPGDGHPIDAWIAERLPEGVDPAPEADARTLIRRVTFDLTGLPPTPEEVADFVSEWSDAANRSDTWQRHIDRLLASPHYGERMARHWLDVVRYADSSGFANDYERGNAWRYRDYVVRSFNADKPYDRFIVEQIAGDELAPADPEMLVATGFLRMGPWELTGMEVAKIARQRFLDDVTNSVGETFLAHSLQCARCHDHKFDPVPTHDYYAIQACFSTTQLVERPAAFLPVENTAGFEEKRFLEARRAEHLAVLAELDAKLLANAEAWHAERGLDPAPWRAAVAQARKGGGLNPRRGFPDVFGSARQILARQGVPEERYPPKLVGFEPSDYGNERVARKGLERLRWELERYEPFAFSVYNGRTPSMTAVTQPLRPPAERLTQGELEQTAILGGGDPFSPTTPVRPGALSVLAATAELPFAGVDAMEGRRLRLAEWIARPDNPLTMRAIVNRVWLWHFDRALAGNPNNFGSTGKPPTHPELLDWLAATFVEQGQSFKQLHRLILTSAAYRRSAFWQGGADKTIRSADSDSGAAQAAEADKRVRTPLARGELEAAYAVFKSRRLSAEELRDAMLSVSGEWNPMLGGIPNRPEIHPEVALQPRMVMGTFAAAWVPNPLPAQRHRRSLYALKIRGLRDPFLEVFNEPGPDFSCEAREVSTVTPQVFSLFNGQAVHARALALANRVLNRVLNRERAATPEAALDRLFALCFGRVPTPAERGDCLAHWRAQEAVQAAAPVAWPVPPRRIRRDAVEENTGEKFQFEETLHGAEAFVPDLQPADVDARTRALADVALVLLNANEFAYLD
jgi:mono/diheme cytochrome c family protein